MLDSPSQLPWIPLWNTERIWHYIKSLIHCSRSVLWTGLLSRKYYYQLKMNVHSSESVLWIALRLVARRKYPGLFRAGCIVTCVRHALSSNHWLPSRLRLYKLFRLVYHRSDTLPSSMNDWIWPIRISGLFNWLPSSTRPTNCPISNSLSCESVSCELVAGCLSERLSSAKPMVTDNACSFLWLDVLLS